jgi:hypothetical protein
VAPGEGGNSVGRASITEVHDPGLKVEGHRWIIFLPNYWQIIGKWWRPTTESVKAPAWTRVSEQPDGTGART